MIKIRIRGFLLLLFVICICSEICFAVQQGGVQYIIPIEYSLIDENELNAEAETMFKAYLQTEDETQKINLLNKMLSNYSVLGNIDKDNPLYFTRLGIIYDKLGKDRWAKSNFFRSTNLRPNYPYAYYSFGNYYFDRAEFKKALREYMRAYNSGYSNDFDTLNQIGKIYEKYGDFSRAIEFYKKAAGIKQSEELTTKIQVLEELLKKNSLFDSRQEVRK